MIETIETILREYELNTIENNNSSTMRLRTLEKKGVVQKRERPTEEVKNALFVPSESIMEALGTMVLSKGEHIGRGHTAYLTFATKLKK